MAKAKNKNFISNKDLMRELTLSQERNELTNKGAMLLRQLAYNVIMSARNKLHYRCEEDREDCYSSSVLKLLEKWHKFDRENYDNPVAYFTSVIYSAAAAQFNELYQRKKVTDGESSVVFFDIDSIYEK